MWLFWNVFPTLIKTKPTYTDSRVYILKKVPSYSYPRITLSLGEVVLSCVQRSLRWHLGFHLLPSEKSGTVTLHLHYQFSAHWWAMHYHMCESSCTVLHWFYVSLLPQSTSVTPYCQGLPGPCRHPAQHPGDLWSLTCRRPAGCPAVHGSRLVGRCLGPAHAHGHLARRSLRVHAVPRGLANRTHTVTGKHWLRALLLSSDCACLDHTDSPMWCELTSDHAAPHCPSGQGSSSAGHPPAVAASSTHGQTSGSSTSSHGPTRSYPLPFGAQHVEEQGEWGWMTSQEVTRRKSVPDIALA